MRSIHIIQLLDLCLSHVHVYNRVRRVSASHTGSPLSSGLSPQSSVLNPQSSILTMLNNAPLVHALVKLLESDQAMLPKPTPRRRVTSETCLPERLPSVGVSEHHIICMDADMISRFSTARSGAHGSGNNPQTVATHSDSTNARTGLPIAHSKT
jgi:hypothetical protein